MFLKVKKLKNILGFCYAGYSHRYSTIYGQVLNVEVPIKYKKKSLINIDKIK